MVEITGFFDDRITDEIASQPSPSFVAESSVFEIYLSHVLVAISTMRGFRVRCATHGPYYHRWYQKVPR